MKRKVFYLLFILFLGLLPFYSYAGLIMVGLYSDKIDTWRYWEKQGEEYKYKMIIFNKCDSLVELSIEKVIYKEEWSNFVPDSSKRKFYFDKIVIDKSQHVILDIPAPTQEHEYMSFIVNGEECGQLEMQRYPPPHDLPTQRYTSCEGLNGGAHFVWITKNKLFSSKNTEDTMSLYFYYIEQMRIDKDGILLLLLNAKQKNFALSAFLDNSPFGNYANDSTLELEVPYRKLNATKRYCVDLIYKPLKKGRYYGLWTGFALFWFDDGVQPKIVNRELRSRLFGLSLPFVFE